MRFIVALIACFMVLTPIGVAAAAYAPEAICCIDASGAKTADQSDCGTAQGRADCDKNGPCHGACHSHQVAATTDATPTRAFSRMTSIAPVALIARYDAVDLEASLRPPTA